MATFAVTGASGLVGRRLCERLLERGDQVLRLVRREPANRDEHHWDPERGLLDATPLEKCQGVFHLAGESVGGGLWTASRKRRILESRVNGSRLLASSLAALASPPPVLVQASAVGHYGDAGDRWCHDDDPVGEGFLASVVQQWEAAAKPAVDAGVRVVFARIGLVLASDGGALAQMLLPFKLGAGGVIGSGDQFMSWITREDLVSALLHLHENPDLSGPVNVVAPEPVTNAELTKTLGAALGRPTVIPLPGFVVKTLMGEMGRELLLSGARVSCDRLRESGFEFRDPHFEKALRGVLDREA